MPDFWRMVWQEKASCIVMVTRTFDFIRVMWACWLLVEPLQSFFPGAFNIGRRRRTARRCTAGSASPLSLRSSLPTSWSGLPWAWFRSLLLFFAERLCWGRTEKKERWSSDDCNQRIVLKKKKLFFCRWSSSTTRNGLATATRSATPCLSSGGESDKWWICTRRLRMAPSSSTASEIHIFVTTVIYLYTSLPTPVTVWSPLSFSQRRGWTVRGLHCHWFEYRALWRGRRLWRLWLPQEDQRVAEGPRWDPSKIILDNLMIISETQVR